jgi:hypothetical protein
MEHLTIVALGIGLGILIAWVEQAATRHFHSPESRKNWRAAESYLQYKNQDGRH